jgi:hypothetical protein
MCTHTQCESQRGVCVQAGERTQEAGDLSGKTGRDRCSCAVDTDRAADEWPECQEFTVSQSASPSYTARPDLQTSRGPVRSITLPLAMNH